MVDRWAVSSELPLAFHWADSSARRWVALKVVQKKVSKDESMAAKWVCVRVDQSAAQLGDTKAVRLVARMDEQRVALKAAMLVAMMAAQLDCP